MKSLVIYESMYGNTALIGEAIAGELCKLGEVASYPIYNLPDDALKDVDFLVIGGPTHMHGMSRAKSRLSTVETTKTPEAAKGPGVREILDQLPKGDGMPAAAFDTRLPKPAWLVGSAARGIGKRLRQRGYRLIAKPESFLVVDGEGPLQDGEEDRARQWANSLVEELKPLTVKIEESVTIS